MSFSYLFDPNKQFQDRNGVNNVGGFLRVYIDGTDDRATTYKDFNGTLNEADIMLDTDGRAVVIVDDSLTFRIEVYERDGSLQWTVTQFTARGEGDGGGSSTPVVVDGTANEIDVTERMTAGVKYYTIGLATVVKNTLLGLISSFSNLVGILNSKADKVQVATAGNLAALDASGNITDSGKKAADFKTKQTPVADPSASGNGLEFIDSVSQDANGEITPHKKSVQDGTTAQKGVVKLSNAIDSTSVTEAATPKAVKDAYDELNNKIVARAVFLSQAEWAVQSQLQGDPAKVYYVENGTGEDAYTVYVWKESTSTYEEVDESSIDLDGYWHDSPTTTGSGNVVTNITLGNDGVPQVEKGLSAEPAFSVLPISKGGTGADTIKGALSTLTSETQHYDTLPTDDTLIVHKFGSATASNGALYTRKLSYLWTYIQNKISSVLGLTASSYGGKAANAGSADTAAAAASGSALETAINAKLDKNGYVGYKEGFWVGVKWPITTNYESCFWKVCSFSVSNYWSISFKLTATNLFFDSVGQETKVVTVSSFDTNSVRKAVECRTKYIKIDERGYGNIMYYTIDNGVVTIYVKTAKKANETQFLRLVSVTNLSSITNLTWYCEEAPGEQPSSPTKFTEQIVNVTPSVGSQTLPVYSDANGKLQQCDPSQMSVGSARYVRPFIIDKGAQTTNVWAKVATASVSAWNGYAIAFTAGYDGYSNANSYAGEISVGYQVGKGGAYANHRFYIYRHGYSSAAILDASLVRNGNMLELWVKDGITDTSLYLAPVYFNGFSVNYADSKDRSKQLTDAEFTTYIADKTNYTPLVRTMVFIAGFTGMGSPTTPVYADPDGQLLPCTQGSTLKTNTATLYIAGYTDDNIPYYHVKDIKNGCVNHVAFSGITNSTCDITFEAPTLSTGEEYDYIISLEGYTNNSGYSTGPYVENCKQVLRYDYVNNLWIGEPLFLQATDWRQICVVRGNTCEWKRVALS